MQEKRKNKSNVPNLRFPGFEGEANAYKQISFEDLFVFSTGKNIKQSEASPEFKIPCVRYGELYHMYGENITRVINKTNLDKSELLFSQGDEILLPSAGEDPMDIGSASALLIPNVAIGRTINILRPKNLNVYSNIYVSYYINEKLKMKISTLAKGVSISNVYNSDLKTLNIRLPKLAEQVKVASFITLLDHRIETQSKIISNLESSIKNLAFKLFGEQIRFVDKQGKKFSNWTTKRITDVLKIGSGKDYKSLKTGKVPVFGSGGLMTYVDQFLHDGETVCIGRKGTIDKPMYYSGKIWTVDTLFYTHSFRDVLPKFIYFIFKTINWKEYNEASGVPSLSKSTIEKIEIRIPSLAEQKKIADVLTTISLKIEVEKQFLEKLKEQKKFLLTAMFI